MKILVTSGGTTEYIDDVRVLTNISTGKLGALIAHALANSPLREFHPGAENDKPDRLHQITYVAPRHAADVPSYDSLGAYLHNVKRVQVKDVASLMEVMKREVPEHDVIIHAMAVSDFGFRKDGPIKLKSNDPQAFIDSLRDRIETNPKVIQYIKTWNPKCHLIGFKFEVGKSYSELIDIAIESMQRNNCDMVLANDKEEMKREKEHVAYVVNTRVCEQRAFHKKYASTEPRFAEDRLAGKAAIADYLVRYVDGLPKN